MISIKTVPVLAVRIFTTVLAAAVILTPVMGHYLRVNKINPVFIFIYLAIIGGGAVFLIYRTVFLLRDENPGLP